MSDPLDVSGAWIGTYTYPRGPAPNGFTAAMMETSGVVTGETIEPSPSRHPGYGGTEARAFIDGRRSGASIQFTKQYDATHRAATPVFYQGTISAEGDEITGRWEVAEDWSGTFIMVRRAGRAAAVTREVGETVR